MEENKPKNIFKPGAIWVEDLVLSEHLTDTDSKSVLRFSGPRGVITDNKAKIQHRLDQIGQSAIKWEDAELNERDTPLGAD